MIILEIKILRVYSVRRQKISLLLIPVVTTNIRPDDNSSVLWLYVLGGSERSFLKCKKCRQFHLTGFET